VSLSREVADAYINIHGDLSEFRKDLERGRVVAAENGEKLSDTFAEAMEKEDVRNMNDRWKALTKAFYSGEKLDWERVLGKFDATDLNRAGKEIDKFMADAVKAGMMTEDQFDDAKAAMDRAVKTMSAHRKAQEGITREVADAKFEQDRYNKSLRGMIDAADLDLFESRWKKLGQTLAGVNLSGAIGDVDWSKMQKGTSSLEQFDAAMNDTIIRARLLGRITDEETQNVIDSLDSYIDKERERARALDESTASVQRMRTESDRARISLSGMIESAKTKELEKDFAKIAAAMATTNWGPVARDHKSMTEFRARTMEVTERMRELGRVSDSELNGVRNALQAVTNNQKAFGVELDKTSRKFRPIKFAMDKMSKSWARMDSTVRLVLGLIASSAGSMATLGSGLAGTATALVSSLGSAAGSVVPLAAAFSAMGVAIGLAVSGMDDLKAAFPGVQVALDNIGKTWQGQAKAFAMEWGASLDSLLTNFNTQLAAYDFGAPLGKAMSGITTAFEGVVNGPGFAAFMSAMTTTLPAAFEGFGKGLAGVTDAILNLFAGAAPVAAQLGADFERWGTALGKAMESARESGQLQATFEQMRTSLLAVLDFAGSLGMALGTMFSIGASTGNGMLNSLTQIVDKFTAWMNTDAGREQMLQWFTNADTIIRSMKPVLVGLADAMALLVTPATIAQFADLMNTVGQLLPILAQMLAVISQLGILNLLAQAFLIVGQAVQPLLPVLSQIAGILGPLLSQALTALAPLFNAVVAALMPVVQGILQLIQVIAPVLIPAINQIVAALTPVIAVIGQVVGAIVGILIPILGPLLIGVINNVVGVVQGLSGVFMGAVAIITAIITGFGAFFTKIFQGDIGGALSALGSMFGSIWDGIVQMIGGAVQAIWNLIQLWLVGKLVSGVKSLLTSVGNFFTTTWNSIKSTVSGAVGNITGTVSGWGSSIMGLFSSIWNGAVNLLRSGWSNMVSAVSSGASQVISFVASIPGRFVGALSNLGGMLAGVGRNVMQGFINGVTSMAGAIFNSAVNAVKGAIDGVKNFLGIRSPSRLATTLGQYTGEGFANGIDNLKKAVQTSAEKMAGLAVGAFDKSKMFVAGENAAAGLASGLTSKKAKIATALSGLGTAMEVKSGAVGTMTPVFKTPTPAGSASAGGKVINIEEGAIQVTSQAKNPATVAGIILDDLATHTKLG